MAKIIPNYIADFHGSIGEEKAYNALKSLPDDYTVFYSIAWNRKEYKQVKWGESDFAVFHPKKGLLFIEVKSGGMQYKDGNWYQTNLRTNEEHKLKKDPIEQASESKYHFLNILKDEGITCYTDVAVWFTSINKNKIIGNLPHNYKLEIILDEHSLENPDKTISDIYSYYNSSPVTKINSEDERRIIVLLAPYYAAIPSMNVSNEEKEYAFLKMTNEQKSLLDFLEDQKVCAIQGSAGTGKTILAMEKCRRIAIEEKVLFLCYNTMLEKHLQAINKNENITISTINGLVAKYLKKKEITNDDIKQFLNYYDRYDFDYKNIIIDEAQDFETEVIDLLASISKIEDGNFYVFYDKNQLVRLINDSSWFDKADCKITLSQNCRNTKEIAVTSHSIVGITPRNMEKLIPGDKTDVYFVENEKELTTKLGRIVDRFIKKGLKEKDIVILTNKTIEKSELTNKKIGKYNITHDFNVDDHILFTTVRKFKGLEALAIIFIDLDETCVTDDETKRLFYVGSSRAKLNLSLVFNTQNMNIEKFLDNIEMRARMTKQQSIADHFNGTLITENK